MAEDIAPELLRRVQSEYRESMKADRELAGIREQIEAGTASGKDLDAFAVRSGELLAQALHEHVSGDILPNGRMYYNIANRLLPPVLRQNYDDVADVSDAIQTIMNEQAGIGIKAQRPDLNEDRVEGLVDLAAEAEQYEDIRKELEGDVVNFSQSVATDSVKSNAEFQYQSGLSPKVERTAEPSCCPWCQKLENTYDYADIRGTGNEVWQRHRACRCVVEYVAAEKRQNAHTKMTYADSHREEIAERKRWEQAQIDEDEKKRAKLANPSEGDTINYRIVTTRKEAYESLREVFGSLAKNVRTIDEGLLCDNVTRLNELNARFGVLQKENTGEFSASPVRGKNAIAWTSGAYERNGNCTDLSLVGRAYENAEIFEARAIRSRELFHHMPFSDEYARVYTITHEYGHILEQYVCIHRTDWDALEETKTEILKREGRLVDNIKAVSALYRDEEKRLAGEIHDEIIDIAKKNNPNFNEADHRSNYGYEDDYEFFAEAFANSQCGEPNELGIAMNEWLRREGF